MKKMCLSVCGCGCASEDNEYFDMSGNTHTELVADADEDDIYVNGPQVTASATEAEETPGLAVSLILLYFLTCVSHTAHIIDIGWTSVRPSHAGIGSKRLNLSSNCLTAW